MLVVKRKDIFKVGLWLILGCSNTRATMMPRRNYNQKQMMKEKVGEPVRDINRSIVSTFEKGNSLNLASKEELTESVNKVFGTRDRLEIDSKGGTSLNGAFIICGSESTEVGRSIMRQEDDLGEMRRRVLMMGIDDGTLDYYKQFKIELNKGIEEKNRFIRLFNKSVRDLDVNENGEVIGNNFLLMARLSKRCMVEEIRLCDKKIEELSPSWRKSFASSWLGTALGFYKAVKSLDEEDVVVGTMSAVAGGVGLLGVATSIEVATTSVGGVTAVLGGGLTSAVMMAGVIGTAVLGIKMNRQMAKWKVPIIYQFGKGFSQIQTGDDSKANERRSKWSLWFLEGYRVLLRPYLLFGIIAGGLKLSCFMSNKLGGSIFGDLWKPVGKYINKVNFWGGLSLFGATIGINIPFIERWCVNGYKYSKLAIKVYMMKTGFDYVYKIGGIVSFVVVGLKKIF